MKLIDVQQVGELEALLEAQQTTVDIFGDVPYQESEPATEEEIEDAHTEALIGNAYWDATKAKLQANGGHCECGRPMHMHSAFYYGICNACINDFEAEIWAADHPQ